MMKRFLIDIIFVFVCFCAVWLAGEMIFDKYKGQNNYSYKYNYVKNNPGIKTLLVGHSHFSHGVNPYLLGDSVFNFAISGRWIYWDVLLAQKLYHTMPNLKTVIIPIGYHHMYISSWHYNGLREIDKEFAYKYAKYMHVYYDCWPQSIDSRSALYHNKMGVKYWKDEHVDSLGYEFLRGKHEDWKQNKNVPRDMLTKKGSKESYEEFKQYLIQIAKVCFENDIRFIAVTCPCADCYLENTCEEGLQNLHALIESVRAYYPIEYKNYLDDTEFRADSLYYNSSHLNSIGADKFAIRIKNDMNL